MKTQAQYKIVADLKPKDLKLKRPTIENEIKECGRYRYDLKGYIEVTLIGYDSNDLQAQARRIAILLRPAQIIKSIVFTEEYQ